MVSTSPSDERPFPQNRDPIYPDKLICFDPHSYSSGRWLRQDKSERAARYIKFDFNALCQKVLDVSPGAETITNCKKLEGGFNRVFVFTLNNAKRVVARLPFALAGPAKLTTASEVATIKYLQSRTSIPIPAILDWSNDATNANNTIGSEYIIMEHATGVQLHQKWPEMAGDQRVKCIDAIYRKMKELVDLRFPAFGSLYFAKPHDFGGTYPLDKEFCIGPHCGTRYWDCSVGEQRYYHSVEPNQGPWGNIGEFCDGLIDAGLSRLPPVNSNINNKPFYHGSTRIHRSLLESARAVLKQMSTDHRIAEAAIPLLFHPDLHKRNIFVSEGDPATITDIIDWQVTSIEPAFWYSDEIPDFATPTETGENVYAEAFKISSQFLTPILSGPQLMDESLFRPFSYSYRTWKDGAVALRHDMIETAQCWKELGFVGQCPYPLPTPKDFADHEKKYKLLEAAQILRRDLSNLLNTASDGWVPPEKWEATESAHKEIFTGMLQAVLTNQGLDEDEPVKDEETLRSIWPFDIN
ncbi:kinase-like domain-containing protein [Aspergillus alliaceus]|uniref:kinase-like domain-containing protein n=1 Tax=Petromyces alliaceus TaxID=209559 RepID=UPI0012A5F600|nr:kinase-like domain-containing protein [Aspergillus alliaceus]KAB8235854.1 kinase-like domain-containing protein [Aspergillus alliaceus]